MSVLTSLTTYWVLGEGGKFSRGKKKFKGGGGGGGVENPRCHPMY